MITSSWKFVGAVAIAAAAIGAAAARYVTVLAKDAQISHMVAAHATVMQGYADRAYTAETAQRAEEQRRIVEREEIQNESKLAVAAAQRDAAAAARERDRLRSDIATYVARTGGTCTDTLIAARGQATDDAVVLLAELFDRADERAGELAEYADKLRVSGLTCNEQYESLSRTDKE